MPKKTHIIETPAALRRRAERHAGKNDAIAVSPHGEADARLLLHELEVHQIELAMQNEELRLARDEAEAMLVKFTDLYDFSPVSYFTLTVEGIIRLSNLTASVLVGVERSKLTGRPFGQLLAPDDRPDFKAFLKRIFGNEDIQSKSFELAGKNLQPRIIDVEAKRSPGEMECSAVVVDITERVRAEAAQRRLDVLTSTNLKLKQEIVRRKKVEEDLMATRQEQSQLLKQSRIQQKQMRDLSHRILHAQEEERKRVSSELHDVIAQTLVGINVHLAALTHGATAEPGTLQQQILRTQLMVESAVDIVHHFARELRPTILDDLGLIPALRSFLQGYMEDTGIRASLKAFSGIEKSASTVRTVLYRIAQEALTNVARHSKASRVEVSIETSDGGICMKIQDNGQGFETDERLTDKSHNHLGLLGMRERIEMIGGTFHLKTAPGHPTTVQVKLPAGKSSDAKQPRRKADHVSLD